MRTAPFGDQRPVYVRAVLYSYHFTDPLGRQISGAWWRRHRLGVLFTLSR